MPLLYNKYPFAYNITIRDFWTAKTQVVAYIRKMQVTGALKKIVCWAPRLEKNKYTRFYPTTVLYLAKRHCF